MLHVIRTTIDGQIVDELETDSELNAAREFERLVITLKDKGFKAHGRFLVAHVAGDSIVARETF